MTVNNPTPGTPRKTSYAVLVSWVIGLGLFLAISPEYFFGPSWSYFATHGEPIIPAGGLGMGVCLMGIGTVQLLVLWRGVWRWLPPLFFLSGFVFWTAGLLLGTEGLIGRQGLIEAPLMCAFGVHKFWVGADLRDKLNR